MKYHFFTATIFLVILGGCNQRAGSTGAPPSHQGRYAGIGVYPADRLWSRMSLADKPAKPASATTADDQTIIVVVDSNTGEVRQCGNMSGYCVGMNPWRASPSAVRAAPVDLDVHAADLANADAVAANNTAADENAR